MSVKLVPQDVINTKRFFEETIASGRNIPHKAKFLYSQEDINWMSYLWVKYYDKIREDPKSYYMTLTLLNRNTRSGRFALIYNDLIYHSVEKRKEKDFFKLLMNPEFPEVFDNKYLNEQEKKILKQVLEYEMKAMNFLLKRLENSKTLEMIPSPLYNECFLQVLLLQNNEIEHDILKHTSFESPSFVTLFEHNDNTDTYHMYSFDLVDLLLLILLKENNIYTNKPFSEYNIENILSKYSTEIKMIKRSYGK